MDNNDDFDIEKCVGKGSFSKIYKAVSKEDGKAYALKVVELNENLEAEEDYLWEVNFTSDIDHPNIVKFFDTFKGEASDGLVKYMIQMEYCDNGNMNDQIKKRNGKKFPSNDLHKWMIQLSSAIGYIHSKSIMHRDLKPASILLDHNMDVKIGHFGRARDVLYSFAKTAIGTPAFSAPETVFGRYYLEADIYSLGCVFLCMVSLTTFPKDKKGDFMSLPKITYGKTKKELIRQCLSSDKSTRPTAFEIYNTLLRDDYEMLCFSSVRSPNTSSSVNNVVVRKKNEATGAFIFSNRPLKPGEKFSLIIQKVKERKLATIPFGFTSTDPGSLESNVPNTVEEIKVRTESFLTEIKEGIVENTMFSFWFDENGTVISEYKGKWTGAELKVPVKPKLWAVFNLYQDILQVQLTDYD